MVMMQVSVTSTNMNFMFLRVWATCQICLSKDRHKR